MKPIVSRAWSSGDVVSDPGSKFRKDGRTIIVPHPKKDLPEGTARAIARHAGWI